MALTPEDKDRMSRENFNLLYYVAHSYASTGIPIDELVGIGSIGFVKALEKYDPNNKAKFSTYAIVCIKNEILGHLRREKRRGISTASMETILKDNGDGSLFTLKDTLSDEDDDAMLENILTLKDDVRILMEFVDRLPETERYIIERRFGINGQDVLTQSKIGEELGMSQANVSKIEANALRRLYFHLRERISLEGEGYYRDILPTPDEDV